MIELHIRRDGSNQGFSLLTESPQKFNTFSPYNIFFTPTQEELKLLRRFYKEAVDFIKGSSSQLHIPEHTALVMAYMIRKDGLFSYVESGAMPGVQSILMTYLILVDNHFENKRKYVLNTVSEYMCRNSQVAVAKGLLKTENIKLFDYPNVENGVKSKDVTDQLINCHEYENDIIHQFWSVK
jgi:hypothetical protein